MISGDESQGAGAIRDVALGPAIDADSAFYKLRIGLCGLFIH